MKYLSPELWTSLRRNSFWLLCARVSTLVLAVLFVALVARNLKLEDFGQFTFIAAVVLIGNAFTTFGTDSLIIREIAKAGQVTSLIARAFTLQLTLSALWCLAILFLRVDILLGIYSLALFPLAIFSISSSLLRAFERMDLFWTLSLVNGLVQVAVAVFASDVLTLCVALLIGHCITALLGFWICSASLPRFSLLPLLGFQPILKLVLPFATLTTLSVILQRLGVLSVSLLAGDLATGLFSSSARIVEGLRVGHYAVLGALLPAMSRGAFHSKQSKFRVLGALLGLSVLFAVGATISARPIILLLFGDSYLDAVELLKVMIWSLVPYTISSFISVDLVSRGLELSLVKATALSLITFIVLYLWLIPIYGLNGAIYAVLIGEIIQAMIFIVFQRKGESISSLQNNEKSI